MRFAATLTAARRLALCVLVCLLASCASQPPAPIEEIPTGPAARRSLPTKLKAPKAKHEPYTGETYRVQAGDTLYAIAWRLGVDFRELAKWNGIEDPHRIVVGQVLRVRPGTATARAAAAPASTAPAPKPLARTAAAQVAPNKITPASVTPPSGAAATSGASLTWVWPADGKAVRAVSATGSIGLEIRGTRGQTIRAASRGQVVYAGSGLRGYGQLLIVKHDESFLSAYAHNDKLLVAEGQQVERAQPIALMGDSGASEVMLHFEIRKGGKAVEPLQYLPKQ